ncbi:hypothetical protein BDN70DRAFT_924331 [Pholiota conissans]|uniref:Uncharacterized protein n=1 Tax=Pholiota conissans TaxID=109636 RepID=A0A9P6CQB9_9AGAR|nr:hypothetical protein BDN70DRAFT_924331 [Pholiota conissans]
MTSEIFFGPVNNKMKKPKLVALATSLNIDSVPQRVLDLVSVIKKHMDENPELVTDPKYQGLFVYCTNNGQSQKLDKKSSDKDAEDLEAASMDAVGAVPVSGAHKILIEGGYTADPPTQHTRLTQYKNNASDALDADEKSVVGTGTPRVPEGFSRVWVTGYGVCAPIVGRGFYPAARRDSRYDLIICYNRYHELPLLCCQSHNNGRTMYFSHHIATRVQWVVKRWKTHEHKWTRACAPVGLVNPFQLTFKAHVHLQSFGEWRRSFEDQHQTPAMLGMQTLRTPAKTRDNNGREGRDDNGSGDSDNWKRQEEVGRKREEEEKDARPSSESARM